jgi:threonine dehydrogenase-like Zn-dependent dehydrogenase
MGITATQKMRSARLHGHKTINLDEVEIPQPGEGQLTVDVEWCGICGSDLHAYVDTSNTMNGLPLALGHEIAGRVSKPPSSSKFKDGDAVFVDPRGEFGILILV